MLLDAHPKPVTRTLPHSCLGIYTIARIFQLVLVFMNSDVAGATIEMELVRSVGFSQSYVDIFQTQS